LRFAYLGSGSRGNAALISAGSTTLLVDCGFSLVDTERRLARLGLQPSDLTAVVVTHEHGDHVSGVANVAEEWQVPLWITYGSYAAWRQKPKPRAQLFHAVETFAIGDIQVRPFTVPHDAREPCQFVFSDGKVRVGILSDAGHVTPHMRESLSGCDALLLECNHDPEMLANGPYRNKLKKRVGGPLGHLSNPQAAELLGSIDCTRLQHLVVAHISEVNNTPELAREAVAGALNCAQDWIAVANQDNGLDWRDVA
jgi:phosphoribosyl 1,2-cyclic phosphodiesterase